MQWKSCKYHVFVRVSSSGIRTELSDYIAQKWGAPLPAWSLPGPCLVPAWSLPPWGTMFLLSNLLKVVNQDWLNCEEKYNLMEIVCHICRVRTSGHGYSKPFSHLSPHPRLGLVKLWEKWDLTRAMSGDVMLQLQYRTSLKGRWVGRSKQLGQQNR